MKKALTAILATSVAAFFAAAGHASAESDHRLLRFDDLVGWPDDDHGAALDVFLNTCGAISAPEWAPLCAFGKAQTDAKTFFELFFKPVLIAPDEIALFTGYFEPELKGSTRQTERYRYPIYRRPPQLEDGKQWLSRAEIETGVLQGQGLEIAWVDDPVDAYFLHIQGSGRIKLTDGTTIRVGYDAKNGHNYRSVGQELVRLGDMKAHKASARNIKRWVQKNPERGHALLQHNPSYVFFRKLKRLDKDDGPVGALGRPITAMRSIAVDTKYTQMGAPVWIEKGGRYPLRRLMIAQDVGSVIKGPQRADIFFGSGDGAGSQAAKTKNGGRMVVLLPIAIANKLAPEG